MRTLLKSLAFVVALCGATFSFAASPAEVVTVESGALRGKISKGVVSFKGVPFAAPPIGALRWKAPEPALSWSGTRDAKAFSAACMQQPSDNGPGTAVKKVSEDCLTLSVWTPIKRSAPLPVMVWIHGGGHRTGASAIGYYDGTSFAENGVILVSIQYRLGALGYFAHPALTAEADASAPLGNYGHLDQIAALSWVQRNIAQFGGDPANVTVFGESAGGASILYLLGSPRAKGLFAKAVVQSGGGWPNPMDLGKAEQSGAMIATALGLQGAQASADQLRGLSAAALISPAAAPPSIGFGPFLDGRAITKTPLDSIKAGEAAAVPLIIGANSNEGSLMTSYGVPPSQILGQVGPFLDEIRTTYPDATNDAELARQLYGDASFVAPARAIARAASKAAPTWLYHFSYLPNLQRGREPGASHALEIPFVFNTLSKVPFAPVLITAEDRAQAAILHACWVAFAKNGIPDCGGVKWPAVSDSRDELLEFGLDNAVRSEFRKPKLDLHEKIRAQRFGG